jgi:hypothetical protein
MKNKNEESSTKTGFILHLKKNILLKGTLQVISG